MDKTREQTQAKPVYQFGGMITREGMWYAVYRDGKLYCQTGSLELAMEWYCELQKYDAIRNTPEETADAARALENWLKEIEGIELGYIRNVGADNAAN